MKKIILGLLVVLAIVAFFVWDRYQKLGPGSESTVWVSSTALNSDMFAKTNPGATMAVVATPQGWDAATHQSFWHIDQGSLLAPYDIFINLAVADGTDLFIGTDNIAKLRYMSGAVSDSNPDGLPIGFSKTEEIWQGETYAGMNCAACHSTVITYDDTAMLIDGAPTQGDFQTMTLELSKALTQAYENQTTFDALAQRMGVSGNVALQELRSRVETAALTMAERIELNATTSDYGNGRVDAVGQIYNSVSAANLGIPGNRTPPDAPVSYPFIWGTGQSDVVQWTGFAPNYIPGGILVRNVGEVLGVFGAIEVPSAGDKDWFEIGYKSSVNVENLGNIEAWVNTLEPPAWPTGILGAIDIDRAATGETLYAENCASCHALVTPYETYVANLTQVSEIGTDALAEEKTLETGTTQSGGTDPKLTMLAEQAIGVIIHQGEDSVKAVLTEAMPEEFGARGTTTYKGRPLNGIWATAPYLHNGSVPTLDDLLKPVADRPTSFTLGGWEFDPVKVGYAPYTGANPFTFDTRKAGNSNAGHAYFSGTTAFTETQRKALLEYLKTL